MSVEYRKDRKRWGYRLSHRGKRYRRYAWRTKAEAREAERAFIVELASRPNLPENALVSAVGQYLVESAMKGRSHWRLDALRRNFDRFILPYFGPSTPLSAINSKQIESFMIEHRQRVKNTTVWNYLVDLSAFFTWALKNGLVAHNPVGAVDRGPIRKRAPVKSPLNLDEFERAAASLSGTDRILFDFLRFTGLRKDEMNRAQWEDVDLERALLMVRGTKTEESQALIPLSPVLTEELRALYQVRDQSGLLFPGRSTQTAGKKIYSRRRLFEKITRVTTSCEECDFVGAPLNRKTCSQCAGLLHRNICRQCGVPAIKQVVCSGCGSTRLRGGIILKPKDLRDYFCTEVAARTNDPVTMMKLLRHTNLATSTKYSRTVPERMREAVKNLGVSPGGQSGGHAGPKSAQNDPSMGDVPKWKNPKPV